MRKNITKLEKNSSQNKKNYSLVEVSRQFHRGPIPAASELEHYGKIDKSFPDRIVRMAENEQNKALNQFIPQAQKESARGQNFGFVVILFGFAIIFYLIYKDYATWSIVGFISLCVLLATAFIKGKDSKDKKI